jgi:4-alpha-glucanotransferase
MPDGTPALEVAMAVYSRLAQGPTRIVLASMEDALGIEQRPNVPGTVTEMPNWRIALPMPIEDIESNPGALRVGELMRSAGR